MSRTVSSSFAALHHIRSIRRSVCQLVFQVLSPVTSVVLSRLDYGSITLNGITKHMQSVLNAAARLVYNGRKYDRISPLLRHLWDGTVRNGVPPARRILG